MTKRAFRSDQVLQNWMAMILAAVGFITTVTTFLINLAQWVRNEEVVRYVSIAGYLLILLGAILVAYRTRSVRPKWQKASLLVLAFATGLYGMWVGTWIMPGPKPRVIDDMSGITMWHTYTLNNGSSITPSLDTGRKGPGMRADFDVKKGDFATVFRDINADMLAGTRSIGFSFKSTGAPNTIELKLIMQPDGDQKEAVYYVLWNHVTGDKGWTYLEAPYSLFTCWPDTGCKPGSTLDISKIARIDIAVSNKETDEPGTGKLWLDEIVVIP